MLDQSFSIENFRKILDIENRKGNYLEGDFFEDIVDISKKIKEANGEIRVLKQKGLDKETFIEERGKINEKKDELSELREQKLTEKLRIISSNVTASNFKLKIIQDTAITDNIILPKNRANGLVKKTLNFNTRYEKTNPTQIHARVQGESRFRSGKGTNDTL